METVKVNRKGITPLMAAFLLLSFAIALGVFLTNLGRAQVEEAAVCPVNIGLVEKTICLGNGQLMFLVQNGITTDINGLVVSIIGTEQAQTIELSNLAIGKGGIYSNNIAYNQASYGRLRQVKITPKIALYDQEHICTEKAIIKENIVNC